ncbi:MAG: hypothetical protein EOO52_12825 [Gammaproteobacteria bacterium]|nr:MAG: hypothetical protein EOO52_12825 [Gammaproteobacteria bacterium]
MSKFKNPFAGMFESMSPQHKKMTVIVVSFAALMLVVALVKSGDTKVSMKDRALGRTKPVALVETNTRSLGADAMNAELKSLNNKLDKLTANQEKADSNLKEINKRRGNDPDVTQEVDKLKQQILKLNGAAKQLGWDVEDIKAGGIGLPKEATSNEPVSPSDVTLTDDQKIAKAKEDSKQARETVPEVLAPKIDPNDASYLFREPPVRAASADSPIAPSSNSVDSERIEIFTSENPKPIETEDETETVYLPTGTLIKAITLNGAVGATGMNSKKDPFPIIGRVQHEAVLPNGRYVDISECFVSVSGYGELSSERMMLRGERISCMAENDNYIDTSLPAFVNGEDGMAGLHGILVLRSGALIARTTAAGFLSGLGEAFDTSQVPTLQTGANVGNKVPYQQNFSDGALQHGAASGMSKSFERISEYYMGLADQMFPVIEIEPGRQVDIFLTAGIKLTKQSMRKKLDKKSTGSGSPVAKVEK